MSFVIPITDLGGFEPTKWLHAFTPNLKHDLLCGWRFHRPFVVRPNYPMRGKQTTGKWTVVFGGGSTIAYAMRQLHEDGQGFHNVECTIDYYWTFKTLTPFCCGGYRGLYNRYMKWNDCPVCRPTPAGLIRLDERGDTKLFPAETLEQRYMAYRRAYMRDWKPYQHVGQP